MLMKLTPSMPGHPDWKSPHNQEQINQFQFLDLIMDFRKDNFFNFFKTKR